MTTQRHIAVECVDGKGRGVIAKENIKAGDVIEVCPVVRLSLFDRLLARLTVLRHYMYCFSADMESEPAVILGYGMIYNHSDEPNADFVAGRHRNIMTYFAIKDIDVNTEITVDYGRKPWW
jgi:SET domain-containing protein